MSDTPGHRRCNVSILPDGRHFVGQISRMLRERTHGCWCSSWRLTRKGLRVWRRGSWRKPAKGEVRGLGRSGEGK